MSWTLGDKDFISSSVQDNIYNLFLCVECSVAKI